jgi:hypothetical protein
MQNKLCYKCKQIKKIKNFTIDKYNFDKLSFYCKDCYKNYRNNFKKTFPWICIFRNIKQRCNNINNPDYYYYGRRGIKCLITEEELKKLWFRDKAYLMKIPSVDRIDNNGNYEINNCQFIEHSENVGKMNKYIKIKPILQYDLQKNFIKEWKSLTQAEQELKILRTSIGNALKDRSKTAGGFIWKYKVNLK